MNNIGTLRLAQWRLIFHNWYRLDKAFFVEVKTMRRLISYVLTAFILMALAGCQQAGPDSVRTARANYNIAIQQTNSEQLLLNLVRLRYRDTPYFMEVASVSTSFDFDVSASTSASLPESEGKIYGFGAGVGYTERPTITYTPLQGDQFVTQLMSPVDLDTILLLYHSGWSVERIFRVSLQSVNGLKNAPGASGPTPDYVPEYKDFRKVVKLLRQLQLRGVLDMGHAASEDPNKPSVEIRIADKALEWNEVKQFCDLLGLEYGRTNFQLTTAVGGGGKDRIAAVPRSLMGSLFYVSQSVEVPLEDERMGRATVTRDVGENRFDWREVTGGLMHIHSSKRQPTNAYLAIYYRGSWFHIEDSDLTSKSTFSLLMQLFALQAGEVKSTAPILTLPVSR
jgi:hypothetical protein